MGPVFMSCARGRQCVCGRKLELYLSDTGRRGKKRIAGLQESDVTDRVTFGSEMIEIFAIILIRIGFFVVVCSFRLIASEWGFVVGIGWVECITLRESCLCQRKKKIALVKFTGYLRIV